MTYHKDCEEFAMIAYHGDASLKAATMATVRAHREADRLVAGLGAVGEGADFRGCAVGCTVGTYDHSLYPTILGVPEEIAHLEDAIFEGLAKAGDGRHLEWPEEFLDAIPVGADLSMVWPRFALALLSDPESLVVKNAGSVRAAVDGVAALYREWVETGVSPALERWEGAAWAARPAWAARAAWPAWAAWAAGVAWDAWSVWMRDLLLRLLRDAPMAVTS